MKNIRFTYVRDGRYTYEKHPLNIRVKIGVLRMEIMVKFSNPQTDLRQQPFSFFCEIKMTYLVCKTSVKRLFLCV